MSSVVKIRDSICRISGYGDELESADIIPKAELRWVSSITTDHKMIKSCDKLLLFCLAQFVKNNMAQYNANLRLEPDNATQDVQNGIALRKDIHSALDNKTFVVVPKVCPIIILMFRLYSSF